MSRSIELDCQHCGTRFEVARSLRGGVTNCPECRALIQVSKHPEWLFKSLLLLAFVGVLAVSYLFYLGMGPVAAGLILVLGLLGIVAAALGS